MLFRTLECLTRNNINIITKVKIIHEMIIDFEVINLIDIAEA